MQVHPVSLGIFNFVNAWSMMFWPVMLADKKGQAVKQRFPLWFGTQATLSLSMQLSISQCIPMDALSFWHQDRHRFSCKQFSCTGLYYTDGTCDHLSFALAVSHKCVLHSIHGSATI